MTLDLEQLAQSFRDDLVAALKAAAPHFEALPVTPRGHRSHSGLSLDLFIQHGYVQVSLREADERQLQGNIGDWANQGFLSSRSGPCDEELGRLASTIASVDANWQGESHDLRHLLFVAAARALLDPQVAELLRSHRINAPCHAAELGGHPFAFYVMDPDEMLRANYCDIVRAQRITARILDIPL